jgi:TatD DNase family protein
MFVDSHCHLDFPDFAPVFEDIMNRMRNAHVVGALCVGVRLESMPALLELTANNEHLWASVGVHPEPQDTQEPDVQTLVGLAQHPKVVAIGETGLDYYWHKDKPDWQKTRFRTHIRAARECQKPLIIHTRESAQDTLVIMAEEGAAETGGVMHCFTETQAVARAALDLGFYISFSGIVTFKNAKDLKEVARFVPMDRLLIETDAPYLAPSPHRGKTNEPAFVVHVAEEIARLKGCSVDEVAHQTTRNFFTLFKGALTHAHTTVHID